VLWLYVARNFAKIMGFESPEPLANLYSRSYFRATWITTALDAGFWTAMKIRPQWLRDIASIVFSAYYLIAAEQADEKVRRVRATITVEHLRVSWNKATTPYLALANRLVRPRYMKYAPRQIRIPRPRESAYREPVNAWLYFDGSLAELREQTQLVLDVPGGGYVAMTPRSADDRLLAWAGRTGVPVLALDYQKAPEFPYPYALNECFDVYRSVVASRGRCAGLSGRRRPRIVVSGDSAGGNLATGMTIMILQSGRSETRRWLGEQPLPAPDGLVLMYPSLDMNIGSWMTEDQMSLIQDRGMRKTNESVLRRKSEDYSRLTPKPSRSASFASYSAQEEESPPDYFSIPRKESEERSGAEPTQITTRLAVSSMISYFGDRVLTPEMMRAMIILYIGPHNRPDFKTDFLLSPVLAPDAILAAFPKTYIITGERDPLVDDTVIFAGRLRQAKLQRFRERQDLGLEKSQLEFNEKEHVEVNLIPGISHGFVNFPGIFPDGRRHIHKCARWIVDLLEAAEGVASSSSSSSSSGLDKDSSNPLSQELRTAPTADPSRRSSLADSDEEPLEMMTRFTPIRNMPKEGNSTAPAKPSNSTTKTTASFLPLLKANSSVSVRNDSDNDGKSFASENGTFTRLPSEEDLLGRRMDGLAGGLMGLGEGARTP
jgi:acetyl esterase/lipase